MSELQHPELLGSGVPGYEQDIRQAEEFFVTARNWSQQIADFDLDNWDEQLGSSIINELDGLCPYKYTP